MTFSSTLSSFPRPNPTDRLNNPSHSGLHNTVSSALGQVEAVIGVDGQSSIVGTMMYDLRSPASPGGGHVQGAAFGGTGQTTFTKGDILIAQSASVLTKVAVGGTGQVLIANSTTATGVGWGSVTGIPGSIVTMVPRPPLGLTVGLQEYAFLNQSVAAIWQVPINFPINVSVLSMQAGAAINTTMTLDFTFYNEKGTASVFSVTTPSIDTPYQVFSAYLPSIVSLSPGNYYVMANANEVFSGGLSRVVSWNTSASVYGRLGNIPSMAVLQGTYKIPGGAPPPSIVATGITTLTGAQEPNLYFRIDG